MYHSKICVDEKKLSCRRSSVALTLKHLNASQSANSRSLMTRDWVSYQCSSISQKSTVTPRHSPPRRQIPPAYARRFRHGFLEYRMAKRGGLIVLVLLLPFGCTMTSFYIAHSAIVLTDCENIDPKCKRQRLLRE